jgi:two-component system, NarL family, sensor kinase
MGKNVILSNEGAIQFSQALGLLNLSIRELSQIADNLVPENLIKDGFAKYMNDFCQSMEMELEITIKFMKEGDQNPVSEHIEIVLYRCFKAIISAIFRFFEPKEMSVNLKQEGQKIQLIVSDNQKSYLEHPQYSLLKNELDKSMEMLIPVNGFFQLSNDNSSGNTYTVTIQA